MFSESGAGYSALHPIGGGKPDYAHARELFKAGAAKGDPTAESMYAAMCMAGLGGPIDMRTAWDNAQAADKQGSHLAAVLLADFYLRGEQSIGVERNLDRALAYAHRAGKNKAITDLVVEIQRLQRGESPEVVVHHAPHRILNGNAGELLTDGRPELLDEVFPNYPIPLLVLSLGADVLVDLKVTPDGTTTDVHVVNPVLPQFEAAAVAAVSRFRFVPGVRNGKRVTTHMRLPLQFALQ